VQELIISCKTSNDIKYAICVQDGLKLNDNALELELTKEELNILADRFVEFKDEINKF